MGKWKILLFIALIGCSAPKETAKPVREIRVNLGSEPQTTDPRLARDPNSQALVRMLFEGLTRIAPDNIPHLALAEQITPSEDGMCYVFTLKESFWSDGRPLLSSDFAYAWKTSLTPDFPSDNAFQLYLIKNAKAVKEGKLPLEALGIQTPDEKTLILELEYPVPYLLELLATPYFYPIQQETDRENPKWARHPSTYVSNGPFLLKGWRHHDQITVEKNPTYWDQKSVHLPQLTLIMVDADTEMMLFEKRELDWCGSPLSTIPVGAIGHLPDLYTQPSDETAFLRANTEIVSPPLRKALALAIDRRELTEHVTRGGQEPALALVPPSMSLSAMPYFSDADLDRAKELLPEEIPPLTLTYTKSERAHLIAQTLQEQWLKTLGIRVQLETIERKVFFDRVSKQDYDLAYYSWGADFHDPINFLEVFKYKSQSTNNTHWEDENYSRSLETSYHLIDPLERKLQLKKCEAILMDAMPIIPLFHYTMLYRKSEKLDGVFLSSMGGLDFKWALLKNSE